jgi:hypothetical protein
MQSRASRSFVVGLLVLTVLLTVTSAAAGWSKPASYAVSSPGGGEFQVCRDGIKFQVAEYTPSLWHYRAYSPPLEFDVNGQVVNDGTVVAEGQLTLQPHFPILEEAFNHVGTVIQKWNGGRLLQPGAGVLQLLVAPPPFGPLPPTPDPTFIVGRYAIQDCYLFGPKTKSQCKKRGWRRWAFKRRGGCIAYVVAQARAACIAEIDAGQAQFQAKYGQGPQRRHALRNCIRETT